MQTPTNASPQNGYREALELVRYEGALMWQIFGAFLLAHTVFLAISLGTALDGSVLVSWRLGAFCAGLLGLLLCLPWWSSYRRSSSYYILRMAQAREKEPPNWDLIDGVGRRFSNGNCVMVGGQCHKIRGAAKWLRTKRGVPALIISFVLAYAFVIAVSGPWWST